MADNKILLVGLHGRPSLRNVYSKMNDGTLIIKRNLNNHTSYRRYKENNGVKFERILNPNFHGTDIIIRWGTQEVIPNDAANIVYNKSSALALVSNKFKSRQVMKEAGVNVPLNITNETPINQISFPVIARPFKHSKGKNFVTLPTHAAFLAHYRANKGGWYYSNFINKVKEFRVHAASGKILNMLEKPNPGGNQIAWNRAQNNEAFVSVKWEDYNINVAMQGLKACKALGCDFLGIDVILDKNNKAWVLEGNSSPTLNTSEYSSLRYAKYFQWLMRSAEKRKHWNFEDFKNADSFAWKDFQLNDKKNN